MGINYYSPGSGGSGGVNNPPYSMLTPININTTTPAIYTPRVGINNNPLNPGNGGALPFTFTNDTDINAFFFEYFNNKPRQGFSKDDGRPGVNPGWQYRCLIFNADSTTGLPSTLRDDLGVVYISNLDEGGSELGLNGWEYGQTIPANTTIWVLIVAQPIWQNNLGNGFFDGTTYSWDGSQWNQDNAGGYLTAPFTNYWNTELDPIVSLPLLESTIYIFGNQPTKLNVASNYGPLYDYTSFGGPAAINLQNSTPPTDWGTTFDTMTGESFNYAAGSTGVLPLIEAKKH